MKVGKKAYSESLLRCLSYVLCSAKTRNIVGVFEACGSLGLMHRDLKPDNLIISWCTSRRMFNLNPRVLTIPCMRVLVLQEEYIFIFIMDLMCSFTLFFHHSISNIRNYIKWQRCSFLPNSFYFYFDIYVVALS